ncbi:MAG: CxxC-x17-CxxC domain-containing protein [Nitrosopumilus sp.]
MEFYKSRSFDRKKSRGKFGSDRKPSYSYRNSRNDRNSRFSRDDRRGESATVTCADCGTECEIPFVPKHDRPVYCSDCFRQNKPQNSENERYSRNERTQRSSKNVGEHRSKSKIDKILKRQETLYSGGSEKFYVSLKEKLFEILGGKTCSSCGFKDERALGVSHIHDYAVFDNIQRGGFASSWGKYISKPDLAKEELRVLCLNCNEIRQPISKPKQNSQKSKRKKRRFFPR